MGSCFSFAPTSSPLAPTAKVIALDGSLKEYSVPVTVSSVLGPNGRFCFLCSSDSLYFDTPIPALASDFVLELNQIYFVLPTAKLDYKLSGSDMAVLAIKASSALDHASKKMNKSGKDRRIRVTPFAQVIFQMDCVGDTCTMVKSSIVGKRPLVRNRQKLDTIEEIEELRN